MARKPWLAAVAALLIALATSAAQATVLPLSVEQFGTHYGGFGGTVGCSTRGTYDVASYVWTQTGLCSQTNLYKDSGYVAMSSQASLAALVDNSGNLLGGVFSLFGSIPDIGLTDWSLLAVGRLIDVHFGNIVVTEFPIPSSPVALVELDYLADPLKALGFGTVLGWSSYASVTGWSSVFVDHTPWTSSVVESDYRPFLASSYYFFPREAFAVPEPATPALIAVGLVAIAVTRRRKLHSSRQV
jgi:hypothetical protein